jgi:TatD DNase family protein
MSLVDSHCHIDGPEFEGDFTEMLQRSSEAGVRAMLCVGTGNVIEGEVERAVELARRTPNVYAAVGVHPHDAKLYDDVVERRLCELADEEKVVAWGEIGLDYHYDNSPRDVQRAVFARQLERAMEWNLPVIIHSRDAEEDTVEILQSATKLGDLRGVMHCFGGDATAAKTFLDLGFYISFAGNVTFKKAEKLREAARVVPLKRMLVETDCPYMSPEPVRGGRNEPSHMVHTARLLAELLAVDQGRFESEKTANFERLFGVSISE